MSRTFTWWRRFYAPIKLPKQYYFKGLSPLLQKIEAGELEFNHLFLESKLEDRIYEMEIAELQAAPHFKRYSEETKDDMLNYVRKKHNKRKNNIISHHFSEEEKLLAFLSTEIAAEFDLQKSDVELFMETFDGTTRQLYIHYLYQSKGKTISLEEMDKLPRYFAEIPKHILKPEHKKYAKMWDEIMREYNYKKQKIGYTRSI
jgi:hypothetical protein